MIVRDVLDVTALPKAPTHSVWLPPEIGRRWGMKIPFQFGGRVQKYRHSHEESYGLDTLAEEYAFAAWLATQGMGPEIAGWVYYTTVVSEHLGGGARWIDPCGAYGFEEKDASTMTQGRFSADALRASGMVAASEGAWSDAAKVHNIVNGYLVDTRRSWWDRLRYLGVIELTEPRYYVEPRVELVGDLYREGSFPFKQREQPYQEFYLDGSWRSAEREVVHRAQLLGMTIKPGDTVLDLGTCLGGFLQYAYLNGAARCVGLDSQDEYVNLARRLARANHMNLGIFSFDLTCIERESIAQLQARIEWLRALFPNRVDHLVCLSMGKHLTEDVMWWWIDQINARHTYLETNALKPNTSFGRCQYFDGVSARAGVFVGRSYDRNERALYRIDRV